MTFPHYPNPDCSNSDPAPAHSCPPINPHLSGGATPPSGPKFNAIVVRIAAGLGDIGRAINARIETVQNRFERLARCYQAIHSEMLPDLPLQEDMAAEGLESFSLSQYFPHHINIFAVSESEFIYSMGFANLRRKGRMPNTQKSKDWN